MKVKTSKLIGSALDWAVAKCEVGPDVGSFLDGVVPHPDYNNFHPSTDWATGGPIIEREGIEINVRNWLPSPGCRLPGKYEWSARLYFVHQTECKQFGPTPLIAAMRCFCASRLGDEIEIPDELLEN